VLNDITKIRLLCTQMDPYSGYIQRHICVNPTRDLYLFTKVNKQAKQGLIDSMDRMIKKYYQTRF